MKKYICDCCGGQINIASLICEYCGTRYQEEENRIIPIVVQRKPINILENIVALPDDFIMGVGAEEASKIAIEELSKQLAKGLIPYMDIKRESDLCTRQTKFRARVRVIPPSVSIFGGDNYD